MPNELAEKASEENLPPLSDQNHPPGNPADGPGGPTPETVTVNLTERSVAALRSLVEITGETRTESINKALQLYAYVQQILHTEGAIYVREASDSELERLRVF